MGRLLQKSGQLWVVPTIASELKRSIKSLNISNPIRRRSLYVWVEHPTPEREAEIIASRTPGARVEFHQEIAALHAGQKLFAGEAAFGLGARIKNGPSRPIRFSEELCHQERSCSRV